MLAGLGRGGRVEKINGENLHAKNCQHRAHVVSVSHRHQKSQWMQAGRASSPLQKQTRIVKVGRGSCRCRVLRAAGRIATVSSSCGRVWKSRLTILTVVEDHWVAVSLAGRRGGVWKWKQRVQVIVDGVPEGRSVQARRLVVLKLGGASLV